MQGLTVEQAKLYIAVKRIGEFSRASASDKDRVLRELVKVDRNLVEDLGFTYLISQASKVRYNPYKEDAGNIDFYRDAHLNGYFEEEVFVNNYLPDIANYIEFNDVELTEDESEVINIYLFHAITRVGLGLMSNRTVISRRLHLGQWLRAVKMYQVIKNTNKSVSQQVDRAYMDVSDDILLFLKDQYPMIVSEYESYVKNLDEGSWDRLVAVLDAYTAINSLNLKDNYYNRYELKIER